MDARERRELLTRAIKTWGEPAQMDMAIEEMAELTKALCKIKRARPGCEMAAAVSNAVEEMADVQIMLDQLRIIFGRSTDADEEAKLQRLKGRLDACYMEPRIDINIERTGGAWWRKEGDHNHE